MRPVGAPAVDAEDAFIKSSGGACGAPDGSRPRPDFCGQVGEDQVHQRQDAVSGICRNDMGIVGDAVAPLYSLPTSFFFLFLLFSIFSCRLFDFMACRA